MGRAAKSKAKQRMKAKVKAKVKSKVQARSKARAAHETTNRGAPDRLDARERIFIELIADHTDGRSVIEKAKQAGYASGKHGYVVMRRPHIDAEIERLIAANVKAMRNRRARVLEVLAHRATQGVEITDRDGEVIDVSFSDANKAAEIFLKSIGTYSDGINIQNTNVLTAEKKQAEFRDNQASLDKEREELISAINGRSGNRSGGNGGDPSRN